MNARRGQTATEMLVLIGFMFIVYMLALSVGGAHLLSVNTESERSLVEDTARFLENEIRLAAVAEPGYARTFSLPGRLGSQQYEIIVHTSANFSEVTERFVNASRHFEKTVVAGPGLTGNVSINSSKGETAVTITKPDATHIRLA